MKTTDVRSTVAMENNYPPDYLERGDLTEEEWQELEDESEAIKEYLEDNQSQNE